MRKLLPRVNPHRSVHILFLVLCLLFGTQVLAQSTVQVQGTIIDSTGEPLPGVNVVIKGTAVGTVSDLDGKYTLNVPSDAVLVFSFVGFISQEIPVNNQTVINLTLAEDTSDLDEFVVVGYGLQRKSDLTGAISSIKSEEINRLPVSNVTQSLQGRVSGVQVTSNSGAPGAGTTIRIRGVGTLNNSSPLFVVDGMLLDDIDFLNPNDVESMEVLKDASATAIYGSRGANGVVIVTTKGGSFDTKGKINIDAFTGVQQVAKKIDLVNGRQFAELANELEQNVGNQPIYDVNDYGVGTDWQDQIFRNAPVSSVNLGASGGNANTSYNLSVNYFNQKGVVKESEFERLTLRLNNQYKLGEAVTFGHNFSFIYFNQQNEPGVVGNAYRAYPIFNPRNPDGTFTNTAPVGNPVAQFEYNSNNQTNDYRSVGNFFMDVKFLKDFTFRSNFGLDLSFRDGKNFTPVFFVSPTQQNPENSISVNTGRARNILWENTVNYNKEWDDHRINLLGGVTTQSFYQESLGGGRRNLPGEDPSLWYLNAGELTSQTNSNSAGDWAMLSFLFRANYVYKDKFLVTGTFRRDGSSRFGRENRFGNFPSIALGYRLIEEGFLQNQNFLSNLKIRGSWGIIGNDKIAFYEGRPVVTGNTNAVFGVNEELIYGATLTRLANPFIQWEETITSNLGLEFGFFDDRLTGELDYYYRRTNDILVGVPIPSYVGASNNPIVNAASVENKGIDLSLNWREQKGDFGYNFGIVASTVNNSVLDIGEGNEAIFGGAVGISGLLGSRTIVGESIGHYFGYKTAGVFQNEEQLANTPKRGPERVGDLIFEDTNGDGVVNNNDRVILGSPIPDLIFGFNLGFDYKGFDFGADFNGTVGNEIYNSKKQVRFNTYNFETSFLDRWTGEGTSNEEPRVTNGGHNYEVSDRFIEKGSFLRLRNIQIGYSFPTVALDRFKVQNFRLYLSGTNLFTLTKYSGYTPEIGGGNVLGTGYDSGLYPIARTVNIGISANF
ncbi:SusC/RagA family TonB-linked outer membrane protein [Algoriphagus boritolerans]|uniref:TonB-linked outer membrane protein, SusC/RagA family n=2 Tax=Algoriphagus TaxID=246875 RepID=A0A1H5WPQ9_9BACT|nr:TonB-dependent receptor [Algoriphagus boritolerans]SEG01529.1 TonB-linked outer membrane protein, SusC/RagA family [Algoriphagus boritolerans DSM 17298 = JCM 18970]